MSAEVRFLRIQKFAAISAANGLVQHTCGKLKAVLLSPITAKESLIWLIWH